MKAYFAQWKTKRFWTTFEDNSSLTWKQSIAIGFVATLGVAWADYMVLLDAVKDLF